MRKNFKWSRPTLFPNFANMRIWIWEWWFSGWSRSQWIWLTNRLKFKVKQSIDSHPSNFDFDHGQRQRFFGLLSEIQLSMSNSINYKSMAVYPLCAYPLHHQRNMRKNFKWSRLTLFPNFANISPKLGNFYVKIYVVWFIYIRSVIPVQVLLQNFGNIISSIAVVIGLPNHQLNGKTSARYKKKSQKENWTREWMRLRPLPLINQHGSSLII